MEESGLPEPSGAFRSLMGPREVFWGTRPWLKINKYICMPRLMRFEMERAERMRGDLIQVST